MNNNQQTIERVKAGLQRRRASEKRFRLYGQVSIMTGLLALLILLVSIVSAGYGGFFQTMLVLDVRLDAEVIDPAGQRERDVLLQADYGLLLKQSLYGMFPEVTDRQEKRQLSAFISSGATQSLRDVVLEDPGLVGQTVHIEVEAGSAVDAVYRGDVDRNATQSDRSVNDRQLQWIDHLLDEKRVLQRFNRHFFTSGDSRNPEQAGILGAMAGSFFTIVVTVFLALPVGIAAAIYLEEFSPHNRWTDFIEVNINNLAAVPSIVYGLLGLAVFINFFEMPRSSPMVGGLVLALMTLPVVIIASRSALKSVPPSIREAAFGIGASKVQMVFHHVMPLAMPGMMTGAIIGLARALGESAPLLMIGMVAFIVDVPGSAMDPSTVLPVQIYLWADSPERGFVRLTSAAILVLLGFLICMNGMAVYLRKRFEKRW
ncbi:MAG: phosphate transporter permease PstA [Pseudomonadota bacterium]|jgi:phosphate transport system permease protein